ncbi:hypothetical protein JCM8097_008740 [Rhodosporidiobolus ruineniae]
MEAPRCTVSEEDDTPEPVAKQILQKEDKLAEIVQLVGKSSLGEADKVTLDIARLIKEDFLAQNGISTYDKYCPFYKTTAMLRNFVVYYELAVKAVEGDSTTWARVRESTSDLLYGLSQAKFLDPADGQETVLKDLNEQYERIQRTFRELSD